MSKFSTFKKLVDTDIPAKEIDILGERVFVKQTLPTIIQQKFIREVVKATFLDDGKYSPLLFEVSLGLTITLMYSDISFTKSELEKPLEIYDVLEKADIINTIIKNIPEDEYKTLMELIDEAVEEEKAFRQSFKGFISDLLKQVPVVSEAMEKGLMNLGPEKMEQLAEKIAEIRQQ